MKIKIFLVTLTFILVPALMPAQDARKQQQIMQQIAKSCSQMKTLQCDFTVTAHSKMLTTNAVSKGKMYYQQPNCVHWEYTQPMKSVFILNNNKMMMSNSGKTTIMNVSSNKIAGDMGRMMMNVVTGKSLADKKTFKSSVVESRDEWTVTLVPLKNDMKQVLQSVVLTYNRRQSVVNKVKMNQDDGEYTLINLQNIKKNNKLNKSLFIVK